MLVRFKKDWFGPGEHLRREQVNVAVVSGHLYTKTPADAPAVPLPEEYRSLLRPSFAVIVDDAQTEVIVPSASPVQTLASFDEERQAEAVVEAVFEKAEAARIAGTRKPPRS